MKRFLRGRSELIWERECARWCEASRSSIFSPDFLLWVLDLPDEIERSALAEFDGHREISPNTMTQRISLGESAG